MLKEFRKRFWWLFFALLSLLPITLAFVCEQLFGIWLSDRLTAYAAQHGGFLAVGAMVAGWFIQHWVTAFALSLLVVVVAIEVAQWKQTKYGKPEPELSFEKTDGDEAFLTVKNVGDPFTLLASAQVVAASLRSIPNREYEFIPREVLGGNGRSEFMVATTATDGLSDCLIKVRGEAIGTGPSVKAECSGPVGTWLDIRWTFQQEFQKRLHLLKTVWTRVTLMDSRGTLSISFSDERDKLPGGAEPRLEADRLDPAAESRRVAGESMLRALISDGRDLVYADIDVASYVSWHNRSQLWKDHVFQALDHYAATPTQKSYVQDLGEFTKQKLKGISAEHVRLKERLAERVRRLRLLLADQDSHTEPESSDRTSEWRELLNRFEALDQAAITASHRLQDALAVVHADRPDEPGGEWDINSSDSECRRDARALCGLAGALLKVSRAGRSLSDELRSGRMKDQDRWLFFLKDVGEARPPDSRFVSTSTVEGVYRSLSYDTINNVARSSVRAVYRLRETRADALRVTLHSVQNP